MEILDVKWFCGRTNVGIVMVDDEYGGIKYYIASVSGANEEIDKKFKKTKPIKVVKRCYYRNSDQYL
jgi:hypothetical protein